MNQASPVLVVIDAQNGFLTEHSRPVVPTIVDLVQRWQAAGGATIFTRYLNFPGSQYERIMGWTKLQESPETDLVDELSPYHEKATAVVDKTIYTLFNEAGSAVVAEHEWTDLYICGIDTNSCVLKTAVDAFERDLTPWIVVDACASHSGPEAHDAGLLVARKFIGESQLIASQAVPIHA
ncbi:Nicotinamidase-related amidase [Parafrankia irregularis]|uniref:Nicotinamidase-related amidase n=1 Tax=Parafrankia irregularis TaxID=795642 RepID=A0A0S4QTV4_9ACTN|nr:MULTISPECIES: cysteine hydrolase [Parafrankia]MBE3202662.1 cysteine hydrolase [Parafrankia sp. CH37]CUU57846.1 Nicotinamidase-related amidase [Parafrankia irregularis]